MSKSKYTLYTYNFNGSQVVSAIHVYDLGKFLAEHPEAKVFTR